MYDNADADADASVAIDNVVQALKLAGVDEDLAKTLGLISHFFIEKLSK